MGVWNGCIGFIANLCLSLGRTLIDTDSIPRHCWVALYLLQQGVCCRVVNRGVCWSLHAGLFAEQRSSDKWARWMESGKMTCCIILVSRSLGWPFPWAGGNSSEHRPNLLSPRRTPDILLAKEGQRSAASCLPKRGQSGLTETKNKPWLELLV